MKKFYLIGVFVGLINFSGLGQTGHYFLSHYKPGNDNISYLSFDIQQDNNGILYFANRSGVLQFDGRTWTMVPVNGAVYSLTVSESGDVYAAGSSGFGKVGTDKDNHLGYLSLSDSTPNSRNIFTSYALGNRVYFLSNDRLFLVDAGAKPKQLFTVTTAQGVFTGLYQIGNQLYVGTENEGLKKLVADKLESSDLSQLQNTQLIFSEHSPEGNNYLIATEDNRFFLKRGDGVLEIFEPKDLSYLNANVVANCTWVTDKQIAVGTLRGGVVFIDIDSGETSEISNYYTGLPDNEVYALHTDRHQGVWMAHDYGFTRAAPFLPFRTFNHYPGLVGNMLCVQSLNDQVYVGTTLGLFLLSKDEIYEDELYNLTQPLTISTPPVEEAKDERKKSKRGFINLKKKKGSEKQTLAAKPVAPKNSAQRAPKTRRVLKGVEYAYKRVEGISGKVDKMMVVSDKLLCGGVGGAYEVSELKASLISRDPVRTIFYSKSLRQLLVSTYGDEIKAYKRSPSNWLQAEFPDTLSTYADYIFEDNLQDLWICSREKALKVEIDEGEILDAEAIPLPYTSVDRTVGLAMGNDVYLTQNGQFFHYASFKNSFVKFDSLLTKKYFASAGYFWLYDGHRWRTFDRKLQGSMKTEWLALFPDIRFLAPTDKGKSLWVITASNELYKFTSEQSQLPSRANPLFLKQVRRQQESLPTQKTLLVDERESALTFEFIQPEYVSLQAVEYRYWVKGLQSDWSSWSTLNNVINFPFLPPGKYDVVVQSKDLFGTITELDTINFNVVPPYWKRPWFYAVEFLFFGSLVVISFRLNVSNARYQYVNRLLSALTIIMLIQFVQTIAASYITLKSTPVADFFIQVMIALAVLPVEEFLRKRMR